MSERAAFDVVADYVDALAQGDPVQMNALRAPDFVLDFVYGDAFKDQPLSNEQTSAFWPAWFAGFPEMDFQVTRSVAAKEVVVVQWIFTGTHAGTLGAPIFVEPKAATGHTARIRGISVYDVRAGLIQRETAYMDLVTLFTELGISP